MQMLKPRARMIPNRAGNPQWIVRGKLFWGDGRTLDEALKKYHRKLMEDVTFVSRHTAC